MSYEAKVIVDFDIDDLNTVMNLFIDDGYRPQGGVSIAADNNLKIFSVLMVRNNIKFDKPS